MNNHWLNKRVEVKQYHAWIDWSEGRVLRVELTDGSMFDFWVDPPSILKAMIAGCGGIGVVGTKQYEVAAECARQYFDLKELTGIKV